MKYKNFLMPLVVCVMTTTTIFASEVMPFTDSQVRAVRDAIGSKIAEWKSQANTDWDAIAILHQAKQWPGIQGNDSIPLNQVANFAGLVNVYKTTGCLSLKEFTARLTVGILLGNGFKNGVVNVELPADQRSTYHGAVNDLSHHISTTGLTEKHLKTSEAASSLDGHVAAMNRLFTPFGKSDSIILSRPDTVPATQLSATQVSATRYRDSDLNVDIQSFQKICDHTKIVLVGQGIGGIEAAEMYIDDNPAVVVFANTSPIHLDKKPNDDPMINNQEVCIFRCTNASEALKARENELWPFTEEGGIHASGIKIMRTATVKPGNFRQLAHPISLIFSAAPSGGIPKDKSNTDAWDSYVKRIDKIIEHQFIMALLNGNRTLIRGNFGLGIFGNNGDVVADAYIKYLRKYDGKIERVVFTYLEPTSSKPEIANFAKKIQLAARGSVA